MAGKAYTSAFERLRGLPPTFSGRTLTAKFQWTSITASNYLAAWRRAGLIRSLGGHSDLHLNLVADQSPKLEQALRQLYPRAVKIGADVLREAGWTTQIIRKPEVAVKPEDGLYKLNDFTLVPRSAQWFERVQPGTTDPSPEALRRLRPAWALADMIWRYLDRRCKDGWLLAPDDIDLDAALDDEEAPAACAAFNLPSDVFSQQAYEHVFDERELAQPFASRRPQTHR